MLYIAWIPFYSHCVRIQWFVLCHYSFVVKINMCGLAMGSHIIPITNYPYPAKIPYFCCLDRKLIATIGVNISFVASGFESPTTKTLSLGLGCIPTAKRNLAYPHCYSKARKLHIFYHVPYSKSIFKSLLSLFLGLNRD